MNDPSEPREAVTAASCPTCGAPRVGPFCAQCGERFLEAHELDFGHFLRAHFTEELLEVDGRAVRSLRLLFARPGELARDFIAGRRQRITSPLRLYVVVYLLNALINAIFFSTAETIPRTAKLIDPTGLLSRLIATRPRVDWTSELVRIRLAQRAHWVGELATFLIFVGVAGLQAGIFVKLKRTFVEHLTLALTVSAWFLCVLTLGDLLVVIVWHARADHALPVQNWTILVGLPIYWVFAVRRFYGLTWPVAVAGGLAMTLATIFMGTLLNVLVLALLIVSV